ncbi:MAG: hypothetical protein JWL76_1122 [Thermoleophilia bacterium]|nr:hypothetical protein [Thermoleophilia bacterium]
MTESPLETRLLALRDVIVAPKEDDGTPATLAALMPCEPAIGQVAVAAWADSDGGELVELVRLDDGARVDDPVALRESLTLLAMVETVEELASFAELPGLDAELRAFGGDGVLDAAASGDAAGAGETDEDPAAVLVRARSRALEALDQLRALEPGDDPRMARPQLLDELGGALRELEKRWEQLEQAAELWSDAWLERHERDEASVELVQSLWRSLSIARRGPLAGKVASALHEGREAGVAMAAAVAGSSHG